ncbi:MAG: hypothetical protein J6K77_08950, partial [Ruminococcus sp.]|nr:hypothetical protein [Ruminococcus sp.]
VCCAAQDVGFGGIANIDGSYTATHVDVRVSKWFGDETKGDNYNIPSGDFYEHYKLSRTDVYGAAAQVKKTKNVTLTVDGVTYEGTLTEK